MMKQQDSYSDTTAPSNPSQSPLRQLLLSDTPLLDVRAEVEFAQGSFPSSHNVPILDDDERHQVGLCYKRQGQDAAIALGHQLVSGQSKAARIARWSQFALDHPAAHVYCWRGGMRSHLSQQWMSEAGVTMALVPGGYKALRRVLIDETDSAARSSMVIIGGKTGTAKTPLINALATGIDLEGHAHHRGSSFGRRVEEPPRQVNFEHTLAIDLLKKRQAHLQSHSSQPLFFEDESRMVGPLSIPLSLWEGMGEAPLAVVTMSLEFRVQHILQEYVVEMLAEHIQADAENGATTYSEALLASLFRIRKRLGSEGYQHLQKIMTAALEQQLSSGDVSAHEAWISYLLERYYDPMYDYQLESKTSRLAFSGDYQQVLEWAQQQ